MNSLNLYDVTSSDGGKTQDFVFTVLPDSTLYRCPENLPLLDYGRIAISASPVVAAPDFTEKDFENFDEALAKREQFLDGFKTWYVKFSIPKENDKHVELAVEQLFLLQKFPKAVFEAMCEVSYLKCRNYTDLKGHTTRSRKELPPANVARFKSLEREVTDDFLMKGPNQVDRKPRTMAEIVYASICSDPRQLDPKKALEVQDPKDPNSYKLLGEVLAPIMDSMNTFGITLYTFAGVVRLFIFNGTFHMAKVWSGDGPHRFTREEIGHSVDRAFAPKQLSPEEQLLRAILSGKGGESHPEPQAE